MEDKIYDWKTLNLQSLDILLCSGNGKMSQQIMWLQRLRGLVAPSADISHVAFVLSMPMAVAEVLDTSLSPTGLYACETTTLNSWPKPPKKGLQVNDFEGWLENYNGKVWVRQISNQAIGRLYQKEIMRFVVDHLRDPYAQRYENGIPGLWDLFWCEFGFKKALLQSATLHCSEWDAEVLREFKVLGGTVSGSRLPPNEWWNLVYKKNGTCRPSLVDQQLIEKLNEPIRIK